MSEPLLYYSNSPEGPFPVQVAVFSGQVSLYKSETQELIGRYPLKECSYNREQVPPRLTLPSGYIYIPTTHPLAVTLPIEFKDASTSKLRKASRSRLWIALLFVLLLLVGGYFLLLNAIPWIGSKIISKEQEISLGDKLHYSLLDGAKVDSASTLRLKSFASALSLSSDYPIRLTVVKSDVVNAYALPGGNIVVYSALIEKVSSPEALVALLAHESTHVNNRHSLRSLLRTVSNGIILSVIFGDATGMMAVLLGNAENLYSLKYARSLEEEADEEGMKLMIINKVSPSGMKELMNILQKAAGAEEEESSFFRTHPLTKDRIKTAEKFISSHPVSFPPDPELEERFKELKGEN